MKKIINIILCLCMIAGIASCKKTRVKLTSNPEVTVSVGDEVNIGLNATGDKKNTAEEVLSKVVLVSDNSAVVKVEGTKLIAVSAGTATITASFGVKPAVSTSTKVTVVEKKVESTISYTLNDGVLAEGYPTKYVEGEGLATLPTPTKENHEFLGWYLNEELVTSISAEVKGNVTLVARWESLIKESQIVYTLNGGTNPSDAPNKYVEGVGLATLPTPTNPGYEFLGWYLNDVLVTAISTEQTGSVTLVAKWKGIPREATITYTLDGGKLAAGYPTKYVEGQGLATLPTPTKDEYKFLGWYLNNVKVTSISTSQTGNVTLVAKWEKIIVNLNITYNLDGGTNETNAPTTFVKGTGLATLPTPTKDGYEFKGWLLNGNVVTSIATSITTDVVLTAQWEQVQAGKIEIQYELNNGSWSWSTANVSAPASGINAVSDLPENFMADFYWYLKTNNLLSSPIVHQAARDKAQTWASFSASQGDPVALYNHTSTISYNVNDGFSEFFWDSISNGNPVGGFFGTSPYKEKYANVFRSVYQMTLIRYTSFDQTSAKFKPAFGFVFDGYFYGTQGLKSEATFDFLRGVIPTPTESYNGTTKVTNVYQISEGEGEITLVAPFRAGHVFLGWYDNANFEGEALTKVTKSCKLYAKWLDLNAPLPSHSITYNLNGGTLPSGSYDKYTEGSGLTLPIPSKTGYVFLGWSETAGSTTYITTISKTASKDYVLYANWKEGVAEFTINYVYDCGTEPTHIATSLEEFQETFWNEFYKWSKKDVGVEAFKTAALNAWKGNSAGGYNLYLMSGADVVDDNYFVNAKGNELWMEWMKVLDSQIADINSTQSAWASYYVGYMRVYAFFTQSATYWNATRTQKVYEAYPIKTQLIRSYKQGDSIQLVELVINDGRTFLGWYDEEGNRVTEITPTMTGNLTLTAKWSESTPVEGFEITNQIDKIQKFDSHQLQWAFTPENATNKNLTFKSSNPNVLTIDENGRMVAVETGETTITVTVHGNESLSKTFKVTVYVNPFIDASFEPTSLVNINKTIQINAVLRYGTGTLKYLSADETIATVDANGKVTGKAKGYTTITVYVEGNESIKLTMGVTVSDDSMDNIFEIINNAHNSEIHVTRGLHVAYAYFTDVFTSVSDLLFNYDYKVDSSLQIPVGQQNRPGKIISNMEFITIHYTAGVPASSGAKNTATYFKNLTNSYTSANYTTGNDGIYESIPAGEVAYHAGDGSTTFRWINTGVKASSETKPVWGVVKNSASSSGYYFTLNGQATTIVVPTTGKTSSGASKTMADPAKCFTFYGPAWKVVDGYYYMGNTWACFTQTLEGRISSYGGNMNSVGIETACNMGSDLWYTYQITAQLVARLLDKYNLPTHRVVGHNMFSGKDCPQTLLANNGELWYKFMECVEAENALYQNGQNYTITCKSNNPDILSDNGRIKSIPRYTQTVSYTVTVTDKTTGEVRTGTYSTIVHGQYVK